MWRAVPFSPGGLDVDAGGGRRELESLRDEQTKALADPNEVLGSVGGLHSVDCDPKRCVVGLVPHVDLRAQRGHRTRRLGNVGRSVVKED